MREAEEVRRDEKRGERWEGDKFDTETHVAAKTCCTLTCSLSATDVLVHIFEGQTFRHCRGAAADA